MEYFIFFIACASLVLLYKFVPNKKIFSYFCILLCAIFAVSAYINNNSSQEKISREQIELIQQQQQIFSDWYADYQKDIDRLDRNWQIYFDFVETLKNAEIYERTAYEQISDLEVEVIDEQIKIHNLQVPPELDEDCKIILHELIRKTQNYSDAQAKVVTAVKNLANPETVKDLNDLRQKIKNITVREVPEGLFTAEEISEIRDKLIIPEEGGTK